MICFIIGASGNLQAQSVNLLPEPVKLVMQSGAFRLDADVEIVTDKAVQQQAAFLSQVLQDRAKINLPVVKKASKGKRAIRLEVKGKSVHPESYTLRVTSSEVLISAATEAGVFYGIQTLRQLIGTTQVETDNYPSLQTCTITDYPQFAWRGLMLDESSLFL